MPDLSGMSRATKAELERRIGEAASMLAQGNGATVVTAHVAETYALSRRQARRITASAYELLMQDLEETDVSRPMMVAQLIANLQSGIQKGLLHNQASAVAACSKQLIQLCGLAADSKYNNRARRQC